MALRAGLHGALASPHPALLPHVTQHVLSRAQSITVPHLCNMLLAFARVNFRPGQDQFFSLVWSSCPAPSLLASAGPSRERLRVGVWVEAKCVQRSPR